MKSMAVFCFLCVAWCLQAVALTAASLGFERFGAAAGIFSFSSRGSSSSGSSGGSVFGDQHISKLERLCYSVVLAFVGSMSSWDACTFG